MPADAFGLLTVRRVCVTVRRGAAGDRAGICPRNSGTSAIHGSRMSPESPHGWVHGVSARDDYTVPLSDNGRVRLPKRSAVALTPELLTRLADCRGGEPHGVVRGRVDAREQRVECLAGDGIELEVDARGVGEKLGVRGRRVECATQRR